MIRKVPHTIGIYRPCAFLGLKALTIVADEKHPKIVYKKCWAVQKGAPYSIFGFFSLAP
jgi:hypothetical protein